MDITAPATCSILFFSVCAFLFKDLVDACDLTAVTSCTSILSGQGDVNVTRDVLAAIPTVDQLTALCGSFGRFKECYDPKAAACKDDVIFTMTFGTVENTVDYLCVEAFDEILQYASCWNQTEVTSSTTDCHVVQAEMISDLQSRSSQFNAADMRSQWCQILKNTTDCMSGAVDARCGHAPACIMRRMMGRALRGLASLMKCPQLPECSLEPLVTDTKDLSLEKEGQAAPESGPVNSARRCDWETRETGVALLILYLACIYFVGLK